MLADFQNAYVRLCADRRFRERAREAPAEALAGYELSARERRALLGIDAAQLDRYADSLLAKRCRELAKALPLTRRACPSIVERYRTFLRDHPAPRGDSPLDPGTAEGLRAIDNLRARLFADDGEAPWAADLLAFELCASASKSDGRVRTFASRWRIHEVAAEVKQGLLPLDVPEEPTELRFDGAGIRHRPREQRV
jgi:hypothetical protein